MKKQLLKLKMLLVAAALCVGASAWADDYTSVYSRATVGEWTNDDITDWGGNTNLSINNDHGLYFETTKPSSAYSATKSFSISENAKVKYEVSWYVANSTGRDSNYEYIKFGDKVCIGYNSNYHFYLSLTGACAMTEDLTAQLKNPGSSSITIIFNTATKEVESFLFRGTDITSKVAGSLDGAFNSVTIGFQRGGSTSNWPYINGLETISVSQCEQVVTITDFTINYKLGEETVKTVSSSSAVGATITADVAVDGEGTYEGNHYLITAADAPSMTLVADAASNVLNVPVRAPYTATLNVTRNIGGEDQTPVVKNLTETDAKVCAWTYTYPMYVQKDGIYYVADETASFGESGVFTDGQVINKTVKYTNPDYSVVYFGEPNETEGTNTTYSNGSTGFITGGVVFSDNRVIRLGTLPAGEYHLITNVVGDANRNVVVGDCSDTSVFPTALVTITSTGAYDETFTLDAATPISISGKQQSDTKFNQSATVDYILVKASVQKATIAGSGFSTIASAYALDCANLPSGLTAYKVTTVGASNVALEEVTEAVAAGTGLILKGTAEETYNIPVVASGTDISATNKLKAAVAEKAVEANEVYILKGGEFCKVTAASTVPAGKAYLLASDVPASARALDIVIGETTGINAAQLNNEVLNGEFFNLQGQRVAAPTKGLYIVNGKKVIIK